MQLIIKTSFLTISINLDKDFLFKFTLLILADFLILRQ